MDKEIKETKKIVKYTKGATITENYYTENEISLTIGKINNAIEFYRHEYRGMPQLIIISKALEILFNKQVELMSQHEMIMLNDKPLHTYRIFGITWLPSPALKDLEFEVR